ncbi:MAG: glutaminyl-peptide cyclotransferase [Thermomicrobiales bacterium]|nr:glutaminyl-peptide cyclotransferase [Thermomicrobiales bacterium]
MPARRSVVVLTLVLLGAIGLLPAAAQPPVIDPVAPVRSYEVVAEHPHDASAFTQGLIFSDGRLYEGTGLYGSSELRLVDLESGNVLESHALDQQYFGEGITILGDRIYQITWRSGVAFVYDLASFEQVGMFSYQTDGWGLTTDGVSLIMSDGSDQLFFRDPDTFEVIRQLSVHDGNEPIVYLNELEYIDGVIWANVWQTSYVARIDPETGRVIDWLDLSALTQRAAELDGGIDVLNGIAWNPETETVLVTGKRWPVLFEIRLAGEDENSI